VTVISVPAEFVWPAFSAPVVPVRGGPALVVRRCRPGDGPAYWRWDCRRCGEYGGGRSHDDALRRAERHCVEHPEHSSSLLPPVRCRERRLAVHPALFQPAEDEYEYLAELAELTGDAELAKAADVTAGVELVAEHAPAPTD
jgi:hypothetical protein